MHNQPILPENVSLSALLVAFMTSAFVVVIPSLIALQAIPGHYANTLPAGNARMSDIDRDGIGDYIDARPYDGKSDKVSASS